MANTQKSKLVIPMYNHWEKLADSELRRCLLDFKEYCKQKIIINKQGHAVPFELNEAQEAVAELILPFTFAKIPEPVTLVIHKSRQMGISVLLSALEQYIVSRKKNINLSHIFPTEDLAKSFFQEKWLTLLEATHPQLLPDCYATTSPPYVKVRDYLGTSMNCNVRISSAESRGSSRGQPLDDNTPLLTPDGFKRIGDIEVGDTVLSGDGEPTKVLNVYHKGLKPMYRLTLMDGSTVDSSIEHKWEVCLREDRANKKVITTGEMLDMVNAGRKVNIEVGGVVGLPDKDLPLDPYRFGLILGDGDINKNGMAHITSMDKEILDLFDGTIHKTKNKSVVKTCRGLSHIFRGLGLAHKRSWEKFIPEAYLVAGIEQRKELLAGLMDTDGSISTYKRERGISAKTEFSTTSKRLAEDVKCLVKSLGGYCAISVRDRGDVVINGVKSRARRQYRLTVTTPFCPFKIKRKAEKWIPARRKYTLGVKSVVPLNTCVPATCIEVEADCHTYLAGKELVRTHNTNQIVMLDEYAYYGNVSNIERGVLATQPKTGMVLTVYVSTANGANHFYDVVKQSQQPNSRIKHLFLPWHMLKEYEIKPDKNSRLYDLDNYVPTEYDLKLMDIFEHEGYPVETWLPKINFYDITLEKEAKGDQDYMFENYPSTPEESFSATGRPVLPAKAINYWIEQEHPTIFIDQFLNEKTNKIEMLPAPRSSIKQFKPPIRGHKYWLAIDPSSGYAADRSAGVVVDMDTLEEVAFFTDYIEQTELAELAVNLGTYYNKAVIIPERNMGETMIEFIRQIGYPRLYIDTQNSSRVIKYGVRTTRPVKNEAIKKFKFLLNNGLYKPHDLQFLKEAQHFNWVQLPSGGYRAEATGVDDDGQPWHDDAVLSRLILMMAIDMGKFKKYMRPKQQVQAQQ